MSEQAEIELAVRVDGALERSETTFTRAGAYALTIATVLPGPDLPIELVSSYIGHPGIATRSLHLALGPDRHEAKTTVITHERGAADVVFVPRACVYDHAQRLHDLLLSLGHEATIDLSDAALRLVDTVGAR